jgi:hypothetical protein
MKRAIEIEHHPNNMMMEDSFCVKQAMKTSHILIGGIKGASFLGYL